MTRSLLLPALVVLALPLAGCATSTPAADTAPMAASVSASETLDITGLWAYAVDSPGGDSGTFTITGQPGAYEGLIVAQGNPISLSNIVLEGNALSFEFQFGNGGPLVQCAGVIAEGEFTGTADAGLYGTFEMTARR